MINRRTMLRAAAAALFVPVIAACESTRSRESAGEYIDDATLTAKVKAALAENPDVKAMEVNVETHRGDVQLSGFVTTQAEINKAVQLARNVKGVRSVKNDIRIKSAP